MLWQSKVKDAWGESQPKYDRGTRRHGLVMLVLGVVMFAVGTQVGERVFLQEAPSALDAVGSQSTSPPGESPSPSPAGSASQTYALATASNDYEALVLRYLDAAYENNLSSQGFSPAFHSFLGSLDASGREEETLVLPANEVLALFGVCDNECSDLDIVLRDSSGRLLDEDTTTDDIPLVTTQTGSSPLEVRVEVRMIDCTVAPCYYAVGVFRGK